MDARKHFLVALLSVVAFLATVEAGKYSLMLNVSINIDTISQISKRTRYNVLERKTRN
jgi:hypothetical protein